MLSSKWPVESLVVLIGLGGLCLAGSLLPGCADDPPIAADNSDEWTQIQWGQFYTRQRNCYTCHQSDVLSQGILSGQLYPRPGTMEYGPNLTPDADTGIGGWTPFFIARAMRTGYDNMDSELCPIMPRFTDMTDREAEAISAFLLNLPAVSNNIPGSICPPISNPPDMAVVPDLAEVPDGGP